MIVSIRKINIWAMIGLSSENLPISESWWLVRISI